MIHVAAWLRGVRDGLPPLLVDEYMAGLFSVMLLSVWPSAAGARVVPFWIRNRRFASSTSSQASATDSHSDAGFGKRYDPEVVPRRSRRDESPAPCWRVGVKDQTIVRLVTTAGVCCQS